MAVTHAIWPDRTDPRDEIVIFVTDDLLLIGSL
jgi:hypothetical protein